MQHGGASSVVGIVVDPACRRDGVSEVKISPEGGNDWHSGVAEGKGDGPPGEVRTTKGHQTVGANLKQATKTKTVNKHSYNAKGIFWFELT